MAEKRGPESEKKDEEEWTGEMTLLIQSASRKNSGTSDVIHPGEDSSKKWLSCSRTGNMSRHSAPSIEVKNLPEVSCSAKRDEISNPVSSVTSSPSPGLASLSGQLLTPNSPGSDKERSSSMQHCIALSSSSSHSKIKQPVITGLERTPSIPAVLISRVRDRIQDKVIHTSKWQAVAAVVQERRQRAANDYIFKNSSSRSNWQQIQQKLHLIHQQHHRQQNHDNIEMESMRDQKTLTRVKSDPSQQLDSVSVLRKKRDGSLVSTSGFLDEGPPSTARSSITSDQFPPRNLNKISKSTSISGSRSIVGEAHRERHGVVCSGKDFEDILSNYDSHIKPLLKTQRKANSQTVFVRAKHEMTTIGAANKTLGNNSQGNLEFDPQIMGDAIKVYLEHKVCKAGRKRSSQLKASMQLENRRHSVEEDDDDNDDGDDDDNDEASSERKESRNCVHIFSLFCSFSSEKARQDS